MNKKTKNAIKDLENLALLEAIDRSKLRYFKGMMDWKYEFMMELNIDVNGRIKGIYKYRKSTSNLSLEGLLTEERFELTEKDRYGKITGRFTGQFTKRTSAQGRWISPDGKRTLYFDMKSANSYLFD